MPASTTIDGIHVVTLVDDTREQVVANALLPPPQSGPSQTAVGLTGVAFMAVSGLHALFTAQRIARATGGWARAADA